MTKKLSIAEFAANSIVLPEEVRKRVQIILKGKPGLFPVTGQPSTGKTLTMLVIAYHAWQRGFPIAILTEDQGFLSLFEELELPQEWVMQCVDSNEQMWLDAVQKKFSHTATAIVIDQLSIHNDKAALEAAKEGHWVFLCIDTPFIGIDVLYNLQAWRFTHQEIVENISGVVSQMLLPRLCDSCKQLVTADLEETQLIYPDSSEEKKLCRENGCLECKSRGIKGRCAAIEVLHIDHEVKPLLENYLKHNVLSPIPSHKHFTMREGSRNLVIDGLVGIKTYQREVLQHPLLRVQHFWEQESLRAKRIQELFGCFVPKPVIERLISQKNFEKIIRGEQRYISCLFCDIRDFTTHSEQHSPVDIFLTLNQYFQEIIEIVFQYEGMIDKFMGDSIMVLFGAPIEQPEQELRAIQCAISIQKKVTEISQNKNDIPIRVGIGINSGEVIAGCLGSHRRMDYTVIGDVINTAARLESYALPGQILIGPETYDAVQGKVNCRGIGLLKFKGKFNKLEVKEVIYT